MLSLLLTLSLSWAGGLECVDCCRAVGLAGCPTKLRVFGPGSLARRESDAWRVVGLWWLDCDDGASFDANATTALDHAPVDGEVLLAGNAPAGVPCFSQSCALPSGGCLLVTGDTGFRLGRCDDGTAFSALDLSRPFPRPAAPAPRTATPVTRTASATSTASPAAAPVPAPTAAPVAARVGGRTLSAEAIPGEDSVPVTPPTTTMAVAAPPAQPAAPPAQPAAPARPAPTPATPAQPRFDGVEITIPAPPSPSCSTAAALAAESRRRVELATAAMRAGEGQRAADELAAALTLDRCNAFAWVSLGDLALKASRPDLAVRALREGIKLQPDYYGALTSMGQAYEVLGQAHLARDAYERALAIRPDHSPARQGLDRVGTD